VGSTPAFGDREQQSGATRQQGGGQGEAQAANGEQNKLRFKSSRELLSVNPCPGEWNAKTDQRWQGSQALGDDRPSSLQCPGRRFSTCNALRPAATASTQPAFAHQKHQHNAERDQGQPHRTGGIPIDLPGLQDACRKAGNAQQLHGTQFVGHFHAHQRDACANGRKGHGKGDPSKAAPRADPQGSAGFELTTSADAEAFRAQEEHVGIGRQSHDRDPPSHPMDVNGVQTA